MSAIITIERVGYPPEVREGVQDDYVADIIRGMATQPDVMITISCWNAAERVVLTINDARSFLGLVGSSGEIYQYAAHGNEDNHEKSRFIIGGERAGIEARYILDVDTTAAVVAEWLRADRESSSFGHWERM